MILVEKPKVLPTKPASKSRNTDGFNTLVSFHRLAGILYLGYGPNQTLIKKTIWLAYGTAVWAIVGITNTPCMLECFLRKSEFTNIIGFYVFNTMFTIFNVCNLINALVVTVRGGDFYRLITNLQEFTIDGKSLRKLRIGVYMYIMLSFLMMVRKVTMFNFTFDLSYPKFSGFNCLKIFEDCATEVMTDSTGFLLIYFSYYLTLIIVEFTQSIRRSDAGNVDDVRRQVVRIETMIKVANRLLNPCLLLVFTINMFILIIFCFLIHNLINIESKFSVRVVWPLLVIYAVRMFVWCVFVDRLNQKNKEMFENISQIPANNMEEKLNIMFILSLQQNQQTFNASNFFNINKSLFLSVIGVSITYTLLFIQSVDKV
ncbi:unnamed protein product [Medioppia subpectinata]|uniref:Uncharacterized protein n=1 Tax=Medioppia subpectinata TaxID=1979941 RepID=A0A7R9Q2D1_9ACAR|nr:unnamed protein product [Medioppia subpectinata]CAG2110009.1 unnamed protein product [Medioppia subpectinata]